MSTRRALANDDEVLGAIHHMFGSTPSRLVLAVSGGLDSMVLLDAAARVNRGRIAAVATFDHRTGAYSAEATALVRRTALELGLRVIAGRASGEQRGEAGWREARWRFLRAAAARALGEVVTAHTRDDQLETVCMRVLRGAGARGLAGLAAESTVRRPFLHVDRHDLAAYARRRLVPYLDDPTNTSRAYLRNRVRHDLLPAIARVDRRFGTTMLALAEAAARLRREVDGLASSFICSEAEDSVTATLADLQRMGEASIALLVPAIAARAGIILDRRGTTRLSAFILKGATTGRVQLSGGAEAVVNRGSLIIRRLRPTGVPIDEQPLDVPCVTGMWRFRQVEMVDEADAWSATFRQGSRLTVRRWRPGDRMRAAGAGSARRVKRFLSDAGIAGADRLDWPVVLADGEIVWIPGVRRSDAATDRSGRPVLRYLCERNDG
jgi:tRNA(Ile)-lysidine synthase